MSEITSILEQARLFVVQHAPSQTLTEPILAGLIFLVAGIGLSVLGARLARFGMTAAFVVLGGVVGMEFAKWTEFSGLVCTLCGGLLIGVIGFQTFRLWVAVAAALVFSSAVMGTFGYQHLAPHVVEFQEAQVVAVPDDGVPFAVPTPQDQEVYRDRSPRQWAREFWAFLSERDANAARNTKAVGIVALLTGLCLGLAVIRWALILSTSLVGTSFVATGLATLLTHSVPGAYQAFQDNPGLVGIGLGGFLVTSLVLQTMLTRKLASDKTESKSVV